MFNFFKKKETDAGKIFAPLDGTVMDITEVKDELFSQKILGDGVAIEPTDGKIYAPFDGTVSTFPDSKHAFGLESADGLELLIHFGMDTVRLEGEGFSPKVAEGDTFKKGDLLMECDVEFIKSKGYPVSTPVVLTNMDDFDFKIEQTSGEVKHAETVVISYKKK